MKVRVKNLFLLPALIACLGLIPAGRVTAQTYTTLHNLDESDAVVPYAGLILLGNTLYGTTCGPYSGARFGTVFAVKTDGMGFTNLYSFTGGSDGSLPYAGLILSGNTLYGTTYLGGTNGNGTVFALSTKSRPREANETSNPL